MSPAAPVMRTVSMSRCRSRVAKPGRQLLVALAAAYEVPPHGGARGPHRMRADRLDELVVLLLDAVQVGLALRRRAGRHAHGLARDDRSEERRVGKEGSEGGEAVRVRKKWRWRWY